MSAKKKTPAKGRVSVADIQLDGLGRAILGDDELNSLIQDCDDISFGGGANTGCINSACNASDGNNNRCTNYGCTDGNNVSCKNKPAPKSMAPL